LTLTKTMPPTEGLDIVIFLVLGLLIAAALQLMVANFGIALGVGLWSLAPGQDRQREGQDTDSGQTPKGTLPITHLVGFGFALSAVLVLFVASLLATEFSQIAEPKRGAVFGIMLWAAYWVLLVWFSVTRLTGVVNAVMGTAIAGSRQLITLMRQLVRPTTEASSEVDQTLLKELAAEVSQLSELQRQIPDLLTHQRDALIAEITERTDLSTTEAESVVSQLEPPRRSSQLGSSVSPSSALLNQLDLPSWQQLVRQLLNQVDLSELDVETLWQRAQSLLEKGADQEPSPADNVIVLDAKDYVCHTPVWSLQPEAIEQDFYERIYDSQAATQLVREQVSELTRADFLEWLQQRQDLAVDQIEAFADQLYNVRNEVLEQVSSHPESVESQPEPVDREQPLALQEFEDKLLAYCRYTNLDALTTDSVTEKVESLRQEFEVPADVPLAAQPQLDVNVLSEALSRRQGISETLQQTLTDALVNALGAAPAPPEDSNSWLAQANDRLTDYFHSIDWSTVSLEDIKPEVISQLRSLDLKGDLDWQSLGAHLQVPDEVKDDLLAWLQSTGQTLSRQPRRWAERIGESAQTLAQYLVRQITHYLRFQDLSAFRPDQMAEDLTSILKSAVELLPNPADWHILSDLKQLIDPELLQTTLESRKDMTAEQIQDVLGWFEHSWQSITQQVLDWTQTLWAETRDWLASRSNHLDGARQLLVERIVDVQQTLRNRAAQVKAELKEQADAVRKQVAIATAWLFLALLSSAAAAMTAGWLAVSY
jgi:hypothetical protein